ncbi:hypothetical protein FCH38_19010 [Agrobacterium tumefaciens]|nr:hypothetical protein [Agrobacterium tumefaciens]
MAPKSIFIVVPSGRGVAKTRVRTAPRPSAPVLSVNNCFVAIPFAAISGVLRMAIVNQLPGNCPLRRVQVQNLRHWAAMFRSLAGCPADALKENGTFPKLRKAGNNKRKFLFSWTFIRFCITGDFLSVFVVMLNDQSSCCPGMADRWR